MDLIKAIFVAPACDPQWIMIPKDEKPHYEMVRALVGGIIDCVSLGSDEGSSIFAIINDEGLLQGLPPNIREQNGRLLVGNIVVTAEKHDGEGNSEYVGLPENALTVVKNWLSQTQRPGSFQYDIPPARVLTGDDFEKAMRGEIPAQRPVGIVGFTSDDGAFVGSRRAESSSS